VWRGRDLLEGCDFLRKAQRKIEKELFERFSYWSKII